MRIGTAALAAFVLSGSPACVVAQPQSIPSISVPVVGKMPTGLVTHGSAVVGKRLYLIGGADSVGPSRKVWSGEIDDKGNVSGWREETPLPENRLYISNSVQAVNDRIYVIGGMVHQKAVKGTKRRANDVLWTRVKSDGSLADWFRSDPFPGEPISNAATCSSDNRLYILGGNSSKLSDGVIVGDLTADGAPTNWRQAGKLPRALWMHGAAVLENRLYVFGGLVGPKNAEINQKVISTPIKTDGSVGEWRDEREMNWPIYQGAYCGFNDYLVSVAGRYKGGPSTNVIWFSRVNKEAVEPWTVVKTNVETRMFHSAALDPSRGLVFVSGGKAGAGVELGETRTIINVIQAFRLPQARESELKDQEIAGTTAPTAPRFLPLAEAFSTAKESKKRVLVFFYSPHVPSARRFWDDVVLDKNFGSITKDYTLAQVDVSGRGAAESYKYGVFRVPSFVVLKSESESGIKSGLMHTIEDVQEFLKGAN